MVYNNVVAPKIDLTRAVAALSIFKGFEYKLKDGYRCWLSFVCFRKIKKLLFRTRAACIVSVSIYLDIPY